MDCSNCKSFYNDSDHVPRLLIQCGHSICEKCSISLYSNYTIVCPECKLPNYASSLQSFPKNLALLLINKAKIKKNPSSIEIEHNSEKNNSSSLRKENSYCQKHQKKVEAFCEKERQLLCINCILEDGHRSHEISSLQNAAEKEKELICQTYDACNIMQEKINLTLNEINEAIVVLNESAEKTKLDITKFYNEIRKALEERENLMKFKIREQLLKEETNLKTKEKSLYDHISKIKSFYEEYEKSANLSEVTLLETCLQRQEIIYKATGQIEKVDIIVPFNDLNKENELNYLYKLFSNQKNSNSKEIMPQKNKFNISNQATKNAPSNSNGNNNIFTKKKNLNINPHSKDVKRQNQKINKKFDNSPLKMNLNLCAERLKCKYKLQENMNIEDEKIPNKLIKKISAEIYNECNTVPLNLNNLDRSDKSPLKVTNNILNQTATQPLKAILNYREIRDAYKEQYHCNNENEPHQKSSNSATPRRSQKNIGIKSIEISENDPNYTKNYLMKKNSTKSPNLTYLSLDTSQNYENSITESKRKLGHFEIENFTKDVLNKSQIEDKSKKDVSKSKKDDLEFLNSIMMGQRSETKESIKDSEFNTFLQGTENKANERLDFSYIYQQFSHFIYVFGGFFDNPSNVIERFDLQKNLWEEIDILPTSRAKFGAISLSNGNIIVIGGKQDGLRVSSIEEYCVKERRWRQFDTKLSTSKSGFGTIVKNDELFIIGGNDGTSILSVVEQYDLKDKKVKKVKSMNHSRDELAVALGTDQKIYAIGGFGGPKNSCLNTVERYDPESDEWETISSLNVPRRALSAVTLPDGIYVMGGFDGFNYLSSVEKYDEMKNEWILIASMNSPRCTLSAVASPDFQYIYVMGGFDNVPLNSVEKYSVLNDSWEVIPPMKHKRFMHTAVLNIN